jgi:hypothetical protein
MSTALKTIKDKIKTHLDALVTAGTLKGATEIDLRKDPLASDIPLYPWAFLTPPAIESDVVDNRNVLRKYSFAIMIVVNADNLTSNTDVEDLMLTIISRFDNNPTLGGTADGGVEPATSTPEPVQTQNGNLIAFWVMVKASKTESLTY